MEGSGRETWQNVKNEWIWRKDIQAVIILFFHFFSPAVLKFYKQKLREWHTQNSGYSGKRGGQDERARGRVYVIDTVLILRWVLGSWVFIVAYINKWADKYEYKWKNTNNLILSAMWYSGLNFGT